MDSMTVEIVVRNNAIFLKNALGLQCIGKMNACF